MIDRTRPPALAEARRASLPPIHRATLRNGLRVLAIESAELPIARLEIARQAGAEHEQAAIAGIATLTAALLDEGTGRRTSTEIATAIEGLGGHLTTVAGWEATAVRADVLGTSLDPAFELACEVFRQPSFPVEEFERLQRQRMADLLHRRTQPGAMADERLAALIYGAGPYGRPLSGDEASTASLTRDAAAGFYESHGDPRAGWLVAAGAIDFAHLLAQAESTLGEWTAVAVAPTVTPTPLSRAGPVVEIVDRPGSPQTEIRLGHAAIGRMHPDRVALAVANAMLGGKFTSRINLNLREKRGLTYGAFTRLGDRRGPAPFLFSAAVDSQRAGEAVRETLAEIERLRQAPPPDEELDDTKSYIVGVFPYQLQTGSGLLHQLSELALYDLPDDHPERRLAEVVAVTGDRIVEVARAHLKPAEIAVVAVGPATELAPQLEGLGELRVVNPEPPTALPPSTP